MISAIVLAGGNGSRMKKDLKTDIPKQFIPIKDKPLIFFALDVFCNSQVDEVILVTRECDIDYCKEEIIEKYNLTKVRAVVAGGANRYDSVYNGIKATTTEDENDIILIHDGARPFVTKEMIDESVESAKEYGACTVAVTVKDTIKVVDNEMFGVSTPDRRTLYQIQTPQTFKREIIEAAYVKMYVSGDTDITDDTMIVERYLGKKIKIIPGSYKNIKVTTGEDIVVAEALTTR